ncbi:MAG: hypothetical protein HY706_18800 [Candidatus Hydrogenedentes bacterium]|nr:hypothetical protein [Candidatus Hydrogenedentota bacterium]
MPQPVDLQTEAARMTAAERIQQIADRASLAAQQRVAAELQQDRIQLETEVQQTAESQNEPVEAEGRRRNPFAGRRRRRRATTDPAPPEKVARGANPAPEPETHRLDISV